MPAGYQYVKIGKSYFCLQQNPVVLVWFAWARNRSLRLRSLGLDRGRALNAVKTLVQYQVHLRSSDQLVELPVYGNFCRPVHRGYKAFNLPRRTVIRTLDPGVDAATVAREIAGVRSAGVLDFAPTVRRWSVEERWYEESFVIGYPGYSDSRSESAAFLKMYHQDVEPCIERMILLQAPLSTRLGDYVGGGMSLLEDVRLSEQGLDGRKVDAIKDFVELMAERLLLQDDCRVDLVFSHGDFSLVNILWTRDGIAVIDWEGARRRSTLFDLYNYFFTELYYRRLNTNLVSEIPQIILSLRARLGSKAPDIARTLPALAQVYRRLYYFERVLMLLERELTDKLLDVILRSIEVFSQYEEAAASDQLGV